MNGKPLSARRPPPFDRGAAEGMAVKALGFLTGSPDRLVRFLETSGLRPDTLGEAARSPGFFAGLLDYIAGDEQLLVGFADEIGVRPERVMEAKLALSPPGAVD